MDRADIDPIWRVLRYQGRSTAWLARVTGYAPTYVRKIACGAKRPSQAFKDKACLALGMPVDSLFLDQCPLVARPSLTTVEDDSAA